MPAPGTDRFDAARTGDPGALAALYRELSPAVLGYLRGLGAHEPEDLTADVFVAMVHGLARFEGDAVAMRSWVFSIAHRRFLDQRRRQRRRIVDLVEPERLPEVSPPGGDVEVEALARVEGDDVLSRLKALTADQRSVLLLRILGDLPVAEVARILRKSEGAVKTLQQRALRRLARSFSPEPVT